MAATPDFTKLHEFFSKKSTMEILGVDRDENAHSKFLGWLFENELTRDSAIKKLLALLQTKLREQKIQDIPDVMKSYNEKTFAFQQVHVKLEDVVEVEYEGKTYHGRVDIVIDIQLNNSDHLFVIIENKIFSHEHRLGCGKKTEDPDAPWQTIGYNLYYDYKNKNNKNNCLFAYLTLPKCPMPEGDSDKKEIDEPNCKKFIHINYQDLMTHLLEKLKVTDTVAEKQKEASIIQQRIIEYITCLEINKTQNSLMAVSNDLKKLANEYVDIPLLKKIHENIQNKNASFWQEHKDFLRPLFKVLTYLAEDGNYSNEDGNYSNIIKKEIQEIDKFVNGKDYTAYMIKENNQPMISGDNKDRFGKNALVKKVVELYINNHQISDFEELRKAFPPSLRLVNKGSSADPKSQCNQVVSSSQYNKNWKPIEPKDDWFVNQTGWDGRTMMDNFIAHVKRIMPQYTIEEVIPGEDVKDEN
jgi:ribosomal protein L21E